MILPCGESLRFDDLRVVLVGDDPDGTAGVDNPMLNLDSAIAGLTLSCPW